MWETWVQTLGQEDHLEKGMATNSSILAWRIHWTEEPGGLRPTGTQKFEHDWATPHSLMLCFYWENWEAEELHDKVIVSRQNTNNFAKWIEAMHLCCFFIFPFYFFLLFMSTVILQRFTHIYPSLWYSWFLLLPYETPVVLDHPLSHLPSVCPLTYQHSPAPIPVLLSLLSSPCFLRLWGSHPKVLKSYYFLS